MDIQISRREVLNNIIRFKDKLLVKKEGSRQGKFGKRLYRALLNCQTGDLNFIEESAHFQIADQWKEVQIDVVGKENQPAHFDAKDAKNQPLDSMGIEPLAWRIFSETLDTLNLIASQHPSREPETLPEEAALEDLSEIHLLAIAENIEEMLEWNGPINRIEAEKRLKRELPGTYLFRRADTITQSLGKELASANRMTIKPYLITIKDIEEKVVESLILHTNRGWTVYRDDPDLGDSEYLYFSSFQEALKELEPRAKKPLYSFHLKGTQKD